MNEQVHETAVNAEAVPAPVVALTDNQQEVKFVQTKEDVGEETEATKLN